MTAEEYAAELENILRELLDVILESAEYENGCECDSCNQAEEASNKFDYAWTKYHG